MIKKHVSDVLHLLANFYNLQIFLINEFYYFYIQIHIFFKLFKFEICRCLWCIHQCTDFFNALMQLNFKILIQFINLIIKHWQISMQRRRANLGIHQNHEAILRNLLLHFLLINLFLISQNKSGDKSNQKATNSDLDIFFIK